jgi:dihydrodipicolinate synthase/N-acetylneuraminate lyase
MKEASFDVSKTSEAIEEAKSSSRRIGILTGSDTFILEAMLMGCDGALIGFAGAATAELVKMQKLAQQQRADDSYEIWNKVSKGNIFGRRRLGTLPSLRVIPPEKYVQLVFKNFGLCLSWRSA